MEQREKLKYDWIARREAVDVTCKHGVKDAKCQAAAVLTASYRMSLLLRVYSVYHVVDYYNNNNTASSQRRCDSSC